MGRKIMCCGPSGTGKTTLSKWISEEFKIPFIETSTKPLWKEWNVVSHKDILQKSLDPNWNIAFQDAVLDFRIAQLSDETSFICDRSFLDSIVYYLLQTSQVATTDQTDVFIRKCLGLIGKLSHLIIFPMVSVIEDDGMRITNIYFQYVIDCLVQAVLNREDLPLFKTIESPPKLCIMNVWDMEIRKQAIYKFLSGLTLSK